MLTDLQAKKLTHYFNVLDFDSNGILEEEDFLGVGENLGILWGFDFNSEECKGIQTTFEKQWRAIYDAVGTKNSQITLGQWLHYAQHHIVSNDESNPVKQWTHDIISLFDTDKDNQISMMEYVDFFVGYHIEVRYSAKSFLRLDLNKDGFISKEELVEAIGQFFTSDNSDDPGNWLFGFWSK